MKGNSFSIGTGKHGCLPVHSTKDHTIRPKSSQYVYDHIGTPHQKETHHGR